jgi:hypothetical protein
VVPEAALVSLLLLALVAACGGDGGSSASGTATNGSSSATAEATRLPLAPRAEGILGEAVVLGQTSVLLSGLQDPFPPDPSFPLSADERLIAFDAEIANVGTTGEFKYASAYFTAIDNQAQAVHVPSVGLGTTLREGFLAPGETDSGLIVFLVPATAEIDIVRYKPFEERDLILISLSE